jgi:serine protease Do
VNKPIAALAVAATLLAGGAAFSQQKGQPQQQQAAPQTRFPPKAVAGSQQPDWRAEPRFGTLNLNVGFEPDPRTVDVDAGGDRQPAGLGQDCLGFIDFSRPDVDLNYAPGQGQYPLFISAVSQADTTLVINDPQGRWFCNDDLDGVNPGIVFQQPAHGNYNIWVGTLEPGPTQRATLRISEVPPQR